MGLSFFKLKKWKNMCTGKSVYHVCQSEGQIYAKNTIKGYYNNLTEKVTRFGFLDDRIPQTKVDNGEELYFSTAIFQYGLGSYDLFLLHKDDKMLKKVIACANWAVDNQKHNGGWITLDFKDPEYPYSSMAQGEGISLLLRAYKETKDEKYLIGAQKAKDFMLIPLEKGGTTKYQGDEIYLYEFTNEPLVLNGWIFSIWGLWDYVMFFQDNEVKKILDATLLTLEKTLSNYDLKYWSKYDIEKRIASPFYHKLHIAQLRVMYDLTGKEVYLKYANKWEKYQRLWWNRTRAFIKKAWQKVFEK